MSKRRYKEYLWGDTAKIPRTTCWRSKQHAELENGGNINNNNHVETATTDISENETVTQFDYSSGGEGGLEPAPFYLNSDVASDDEYLNDSDYSDESSHSTFLQSDNESSSDENDEEVLTNLIGYNQPIYEGANLTSNQSLLLLMSFILKHQLTDDAVNDFLTIMNLHLPNVVPESKYLFYKKFNYQAFDRHYFCGDCTFYFGGTSDQCDPDLQCSCRTSKRIEDAQKNKCYFSYWPLESQLKLMLQDDTLANCLLNRMEKDHSGDITDATDGSLYKQLKEVHGYGINDISLLWNADGVPVFR